MLQFFFQSLHILQEHNFLGFDQEAEEDFHHFLNKHQFELKYIYINIFDIRKANKKKKNKNLNYLN
jgi:hypothetical protein